MKEGEGKPVRRGVSGILVIDKPRGPSSHQVTAWIRDLLGVDTGHSGTLDPMVSGVLVVMLGRTARLAPILQQSDKEYIVLMRMHREVERGELEGIFREFTGRIYQRPPRRSAVKRSLRIRTIYRMDLLDTEGRLVLARVVCDAGTYIRSLCHHVGLALATGAQLVELRRTRSGSFTEGDLHTLQELKLAVEERAEGSMERLSRMILPPSRATQGIPHVVIRDTAVDAICHGARLAVQGILQHSGFRRGDSVAVLTQREELVCIGEALVASEEIAGMRTGLVIAPRIVLMERGTYPRCWGEKGERS